MATASRSVTVLGLVLALVLTSSACSGRTGLPQGGPTTAEDVLARALAREMPKSVQGLARLDTYVKGEARKADLLIAARRPDAVQMQVLSPTLDLLAVMNTDGKRFTSFERGGAECYVGDACAHNLARIIPIALPPEQFVAALLGRPPLLDTTPQTLHWDDERKLYRIDQGPQDGLWQQVYVQPGTFRFVGTVLHQGATRVASIQYDGEVGINGPPRTLRFKDTRQELDVSVTLREVEVGTTIADDVFAVTCPEGMRTVDLPCGPVAPRGESNPP
jgi:hypothetical protein